MTRIARYRQSATEYLELARRAASLSDRARLLDIAARWHEAAEALEMLSDKLEPDALRPAFGWMRERPN